MFEESRSRLKGEMTKKPSSQTKKKIAILILGCDTPLSWSDKSVHAFITNLRWFL